LKMKTSQAKTINEMSYNYNYSDFTIVKRQEGVIKTSCSAFVQTATFKRLTI